MRGQPTGARLEQRLGSRRGDDPDGGCREPAQGTLYGRRDRPTNLDGTVSRGGAAQGPSGAPPSPLCRVRSGRRVLRQPTVKKQSACKASPVTDGRHTKGRSADAAAGPASLGNGAQ
ncbi:unnamed protein product [Rangifer tarandus platyrhynchus]|uniref:Uncharacterized protein n=2 Tax=Rangifer tarandus platyrhynchus TaxID=3082113 RepID=A0ACB0F841_RANTA|nr:unnamed protein product [Rangifer tarandus platyrhynchus]CAI9708663.1 unnamed protein product [Rangifer tarandus platyrhynchus]